MGRTVAIRTIRKVRKAEISRFENMTRKEIFNDYKNILSLFESEYLSDTYSSMQKFLTKIETLDGQTLYIAHTKILTICSDELLAGEVESRIRNYVPGTYRDITKLVGETLTSTEVKFKRTGNEPDKAQKVERSMRFKIPEKERGVHIFFFDDMG